MQRIFLSKATSPSRKLRSIKRQQLKRRLKRQQKRQPPKRPRPPRRAPPQLFVSATPVSRTRENTFVAIQFQSPLLLATRKRSIQPPRSTQLPRRRRRPKRQPRNQRRLLQLNYLK
ncbi:hypothetical protein BCV72DRAFT_87750 [Rhizopus microsporus var. microsporus]|uniref:Uncharacterized protein n=1 Tax=Rhizopus microsporus var. microsporus TaxID=86635 RepID=A0A1X0R9C9_RHIZD|nr:hypothetical protein BCV72DRAFT_87750 [Rhizopus microsporus var. microsporus]